MTEPFDADFYMATYPDVALTGLEPRIHYERYGRMFGRAPHPGALAALAPVPTDPALLDLQYAQGRIDGAAETRHPERVSVLMPSCNNEPWLARAIHSVLSQQGVDVELLVIDDGSTDGSVALARRIAQTAPSMQVISLLRNFGCYYARNVGLMHARGDYVTVLDSDDIMAPDRIARQLDALKAQPHALACLSRSRRWTQDFQQPVSALKHAENTLLWRRDVMEDLGGYDTVRFGGDTEFRERLQAIHGDDCVIRIPDELYYLRTLQHSLTAASTASRAYVEQDGRLTLSLSPERQAYSRNIVEWHRQIRSGAITGEARALRFPQTSRPFRLGAPEQNASPSLGQKRIGAMASFPARRDSLEAVIASVAPQLDRLILYLNEYDHVPDFAKDPRIQVVLGPTAAGDLRDNGKFFDLPQDDQSYVFTLDDDILYPPDYVAQAIHHIEKLGRACVVGFHGVVFPAEDFDDLKQRTVHHFARAHAGRFVDLLGTGTTAWHSSTLKLSLDDFGRPGLCDLWFARAGAQRRIPFYCAPREDGWLKVFAQFEDCLFHEARSRPDAYFDVYNRHLAPALKGGQVRRSAETYFARRFDPATLASAGLESASAMQTAT